MPLCVKNMESTVDELSFGESSAFVSKYLLSLLSWCCGVFSTTFRARPISVRFPHRKRRCTVSRCDFHPTKSLSSVQVKLTSIFQLSINATNAANQQWSNARNKEKARHSPLQFHLPIHLRLQLRNQRLVHRFM